MIIEHRINTANQLGRVPKNHGVEIDLRTDTGRVILHHDPFQKGEFLENWLNAWSGQFLVLNVKEEGIEENVLRILSAKGISDYFFLDQSFPYLQKTIKSGNRKLAMRVSDLESIETVIRTNSEWIWIDCFSGDWSFLPDILKKVKEQNPTRKICLVSPEIVRTEIDTELTNLFEIIRQNDLKLDAVCTKLASIWC